jgi:hypothetical protein
LTEFVIRRAARGVGISRHGLDNVASTLRSRLPPLPQPHLPQLDTLALLKAREQIDLLSDYIEDQAIILADFVEDQTAMFHEKSIDSLRQARRGLDKIIREAKGAVGLEESPHKKTKKEPLPKVINRKVSAKALKRLGADDREWEKYLKREAEVIRRGVRDFPRRGPYGQEPYRSKMAAASGPAMGEEVKVKFEQRSRGKKIWDAIHHVSDPRTRAMVVFDVELTR